MLSDRERRTLARIERELVASDPDLVRLFAGAASRRPERDTPIFLLVTGLALLVFGSLIAVVPVAVVGMIVSVVALFTARGRTSMIRRPGFA
ncbi:MULTISPECIES: DUF3040 domain-containing protein [unclassified Pseudonocardia]|uniref:DUF3040 domain-containing protein n=1 Tax=unclassified Pseudonocardia TaxID=2619320 RepID=UPI00096879AE|nr:MULTISPECIES: DUF3040 domain-containing protein [unclassified Pseudonocardia]MBN9098936.1 DUF3040 domain-containing protein [Pseudonocardia sp.]OJY40646.1 MAG: hypothetical protein BGP03_26235 [Pseudonocardia sp. 73-21]